MNDLVFIQDNERAITTSQKIAERFGKKHTDVLKAIRNLECSDDFNGRNFAPVEYTDKKGQSRPMYEITHDGFSFLVMGFTGKDAAKFKEEFITAFNQMEQLLLSDAYILKRADQIKDRMILMLQGEIEQKDEVIALQSAELKESAHKVQYHDEVLSATNTHTTTTIAKELGMSGQKLNSILRELGVQYYHDGHWILYAKHQSKGYTKTKTFTYEGADGKTRTSITTVWTESGRQAIHRAVARYQEKKTAEPYLRVVV